jgi:hypothetical protein
VSTLFLSHTTQTQQTISEKPRKKIRADGMNAALLEVKIFPLE